MTVYPISIVNGLKYLTRSQATGEPSVLFGVGVMFAIRSALQASRKDRNLDLKEWVQLG